MMAVALLAGRAAAAFQPPANPRPPAIETAHLQLTPSASVAAPASGSRSTLALDIVPKPSMHVYAPGQAKYIPISVTVDPDPAFTVATPKYPKAEKRLMPALNETQLVYSQPFRITQEITLTRAAAGGTLTVKGTVRYQACDEAVCYLPKNVPVEWKVKVK